MAAGVPLAAGIGIVPAALLQYVVVLPVLVVCTDDEVMFTVEGEQTAGGLTMVNVGAGFTVIDPNTVMGAQVPVVVTE